MARYFLKELFIQDCILTKSILSLPLPSKPLPCPFPYLFPHLHGSLNVEYLLRCLSRWSGTS